jgi:hypothetical protein
MLQFQARCSDAPVDDKGYKDDLSVIADEAHQGAKIRHI